MAVNEAGYSHVLVAALLCALATAAAADVTQRRVPNLITVFVAACGAIAQVVTHGWLALAAGFGAGILVVALLWLPWTRGGLGGGDVKLAGATAVWFGFSHLLPFVLFSALAGGGVAMVYYLRSNPEIRQAIRRNLVAALLWRHLPATTSGAATGIPYAVGIAVGAALTLLVTP